ncbi:MAG: NADPH-dependent 7-cyano-7-deazaguanine reductase QueF [SAR86 cluster bacterium]|jgi:7-cyano-7-deazaguanine reductase|uniref:NADPH-dependent 7-cyano-7-deazaguanine reductase n=1 Tax=SAR86 cluster bacterium TaxID=2030880 RepID=A0A972VTG4_9GAMM|nr:NADPH-dependent 7-cyano-7-deazaguanine reductase QueF [SAR86 cluster bacterium]|tara:strand:- start:6955 stop:7797 length:843 start_codon:yes stop_codon:yes gene_type:complete
MADETVLPEKIGGHYNKSVEYVTSYRPSLLESIPRQNQRQLLGLSADALPFRGVDVWNAYEFSWLNSRGRPEVAVAQIQVPAKSINIIESKSLKLYLGSYSGTHFERRAEVINTLEADLTLAARGPVSVTLFSPDQVQQHGIGILVGQSLDNLDAEMNEYTWNPDHLEIVSDTIVRESLYTHLFKSLCPLTGQPDYASVVIQYHGRNISHRGLLSYLVSFREHPEFAEQIGERIFIDIMNRCKPEQLTVQARFTRRGGIDINPYRSHSDVLISDVRLWRQ